MTSPLLVLEDVVKTFTVPRGLFGSQTVSAVAGVSLDVGAREVVGLVGESGSGKTTLARAVLGLAPIDSGRIIFDGVDVATLNRREVKEFRRRVQPVFQDPFASLDPRWTVARSVRESLDHYRVGTPQQRDRQVLELLDRVGLSDSYAQRLPRQLSGGQRQRVGIAAALASSPDLIVADEPVSALDVSVQAQVLNLMASLQHDLGVAVLFVAHDLAVVEHISQRVAVMYLGKLVETGSASEVFRSPRHPYTRALVEAIPHPDPARRRDFAPIDGEIPSPLSPPTGCRFHPRCPLAIEECKSLGPVLVSVTPSQQAACLVTAPAPPTQHRPRTGEPSCQSSP